MKRIYIEITESWGDGCACSTIKLSRRRWAKILIGEIYETSATSYYDGERSIVDWCFENRKLWISGEDSVSHVEELDIEDLEYYLIGGDEK